MVVIRELLISSHQNCNETQSRCHDEKMLFHSHSLAPHGSSVCVFLVALLCAGALGTPLRTASDPKPCTERARGLLSTLKRVLDAALEERSGSDVLFHGFNCTELHAEPTPHSSTVSVCQPTQDVMCSGQGSSVFSEPECLKNIKGDLQYYESMLRAYVTSLDQKHKAQSISNLSLITESIQTLQECPELQPITQRSPAPIWKATDSFDDRMDLCKQLKGFHIRAITINRALGYISAGDYKK